MAEQLWFLRHGEAEPHGERPDEQRRLTERGETQSRAAGRALAMLELTFQLVVTSPRVRSLDTARLACEELRCDPLEHEALSSGFGVGDVAELVHIAGPDKRLLLVGHNPDFEQVVHDLSGSRIDLKKGGIAAVRLEGARRGVLIALMRPHEIARIGAEGRGRTN
ncbi:MAG: histidine phosphatase family protein [Solirubrobacteraceae bacterium]